MSEDLDVSHVHDAGLEQRRRALLVPAVLASVIVGPLMMISVLFRVAGELLMRSDRADLTPEGVTYLPPSDGQRAHIIAMAGVPLVAGLGLLLLTWRFRGQGRRRATIVCAAAAVVMAGIALVNNA